MIGTKYFCIKLFADLSASCRLFITQSIHQSGTMSFCHLLDQGEVLIKEGSIHEKNPQSVVRLLVNNAGDIEAVVLLKPLQCLLGLISKYAVRASCVVPEVTELALHLLDRSPC